MSGLTGNKWIVIVNCMYQNSWNRTQSCEVNKAIVAYAKVLLTLRRAFCLHIHSVWNYEKAVLWLRIATPVTAAASVTYYRLKYTLLCIISVLQNKTKHQFDIDEHTNKLIQIDIVKQFFKNCTLVPPIVTSKRRYNSSDLPRGVFVSYLSY